MLKNKKVFIIISLLFIILFFNISSCFASISYTQGNIDYVVPDLPSDVIGSTYCIIDCHFNGYDVSHYLFYTHESNVKLLRNTDRSVEQYYFVDSNNNKVTNVYFRELKYGSDSWGDVVSSGLFFGNGAVGRIDSNYIGYANCNCYNLDGTVFFKAPAKGILVQKLEGVEMSQIMKEIIVILPLTIVVVVSLVGLRKALAMLFTLLRKA